VDRFAATACVTPADYAESEVGTDVAASTAAVMNPAETARLDLIFFEKPFDFYSNRRR
jgi:hypothetical protein